MSIESVDMDKALSSASYAQQVLRSGKVSVEQKGQLAAKWGADNVNKWLSVDSTKYEIDDVSYDAAKAAGKDAAKDSTGYDGKGGSTISAVGSAVGATGAVVGAVAPSLAGNLAKGGLNAIGKDMGSGLVDSIGTKAGKSATAAETGTKKLGAYATVILAAAVAAKYWLTNHNKDEHNAAEHLKNSELPEANASLNEAQGVMTDASEEITELTEEAEDINEEANQKIEEDKTLFDFYRQQYEALKLKKENGEKLTPDEQALMKQLAPLMEGLNEDITSTSEDTSGEVNDINDTIGEYQDTFDEAGETIAEVEGVTDFAEGFDEKSRTLMYVEGASQGLNAASAYIAAAQLTASGWWNWAFAAIGYAAGASSTGASAQQLVWAKDMSDEIHTRRDVQELGEQTNEVYEEELENYAGNIEVVEDLELEIPEDMETPVDNTSMTGASQSTPLTTRADNQNANAAGKNDDNKKEDEKKKLEEDNNK